MDDIKPKFSCPSCLRGVLARAAEKCLFCGASLPADVRLSAEEIRARAKADDAMRERERQQGPQTVAGMEGKGFDGLTDAHGALGDL